MCLKEGKDSDNEVKDTLFKYRKGAYLTKLRSTLGVCYIYNSTRNSNMINLLEGMAVGKKYIITLT